MEEIMSANIETPTSRIIMSYFLICKHDFVKTKESVILPTIYTDKRNALEEMEEIAKSAVVAVNGVEHANKCMYDDKRFNRIYARPAIEKKYFITRDAAESPDQLTVYRKYDLTKTAPGKIYGMQTWVETIIEKQFSVRVVKISADNWGSRPNNPNVVYKTKWLENARKLPKNMTEDEYIAAEHRELCKDYSDMLKTTAIFKVLSKRLDSDEIAPINLPKIRFENPAEFLPCPLASVYVPAVDPAKVEPVVVTPPPPPPPPPVPTVETPASQ
jgi:hypothetical protein